jgi:DNA gyrase/topoisomerase IV subunit A
MAELVREKKIEGISDIRDESDENIRVVIELKRGVIAQVVLNNLYQHTQLETTFGAIMLAIDKGRPKVLNLRELLQCFLDPPLRGHRAASSSTWPRRRRAPTSSRASRSPSITWTRW